MRIESAAGFTLETLADLFTAGFAGYFVPIEMSATGLARMARTQNIDLAASRVVVADDAPVGLALVAIRGATTRLAAMGVTRAARRTGVGWTLVREVVDDALARGGRRLMLEVITHNTAAIALYERAGFRRIRRLIGWEAEPGGGASAALEAADPADVARAVTRWAPADLPWQLDPASLAAYGPPATGFALGDRAMALVGDPEAETIDLLALAGVDADARRALLSALRDRFADRPWRLPAVRPEGLDADILPALGFERAAIGQWEMARPLVDPIGGAGR